MKNKRVAIIGGGPTGLALAYFLGRQGWPVTIIEKGPQLSGLLTFTTVNDIPIERFYHHFFTTDSFLLNLLGELGLSHHIVWRDSVSAVYHDRQLYPFTTKIDYLRLPFLSTPAKIKAGFAALKLRRQDPLDLPSDLTAATFLRQQFGEEGWATMWRTMLINKFGDMAEKISAQWVAKRIQTRAGSERHGREVLGYIDGSYRVLFDTLCAKIEQQGGQIVLNAEVTNLKKTPRGHWQINGQEYDLVVSTIAPNLIKKIAPEIEMPAVSYRGAICPLFVLRSSITPYYWINILDERVPFSVIVNQQALLPAGYYRGQWPLYIGHYVPESSELFTKSDEELAEYYLGYLRKIWLGIDAEIISYEIGRAKNTQPIVTAPWTPLQHTTNIPHLYLTSMAHIFPEDRGVNFSIREAQQIVSLLETAEE